MIPKIIDIYKKIYRCICGSKEFRPIIGCISNTIEIVCAKCGRNGHTCLSKRG